MHSIDNDYDQVYQRESNFQTTNTGLQGRQEHKRFPGMFAAEVESVDISQENRHQIHNCHGGHHQEPQKTTTPRILVLCDDFINRSTLRDFLQNEGYGITEKMFAEAFPHNNDECYCGVLLDMGTCHLSLESLMEFMNEYFRDVPVIVVDEHRQNDERMKRLKDFAFSYVVRPCNRKDLLAQIEYAVKFSRLLRENRELKQSVSMPTFYPEMYGTSPACENRRRQIAAFAKLGGPILIQGATGSGKTITALQIHVSGARADHPFQIVHCDSDLPFSMETVLFGHAKNPYSGLPCERLGLMQLVDGGTLYFSQVSLLPHSTQEKLSRYLKDGCYYRFGEKHPTFVDVQIIAGTSHNLSVTCLNNNFLDELYYQLSSRTIQLSDLKDLADDIPTFTRTLISTYARVMDSPVHMISNEALAKLQKHSWNGNFQELIQVIYRACSRAKNSTITEKDIIFDGTSQPLPGNGRESLGLAGMTLAEMERHLIIETLAANGGNRASSARQLGISEKTIYNKSKQYKLKGML